MTKPVNSLTVTQVAARLNISGSLVRRYAVEGRFGEVERFGERAYSFTAEQVAAFIEERAKPRTGRGRRPNKPPEERVWKWARSAQECVGRVVAIKEKEYDCIGRERDWLLCRNSDGIIRKVFWTTVSVLVE